MILKTLFKKRDVWYERQSTRTIIFVEFSWLLLLAAGLVVLALMLHE